MKWVVLQGFQSLIKCQPLSHLMASLPQVANEVELMMKFDHPNLVKAYHYVTWGSSGVSLSLSRPVSVKCLVVHHLACSCCGRAGCCRGREHVIGAPDSGLGLMSGCAAGFL